LNRMTLNLMLPRGARVETVTQEGKEETPLVYEDSGFPVVWDLIEIPAGEKRRMSVTYQMPAGYTRLDEFLMTFTPQPTVNRERFSLTVVPPPGFTIKEATGADSERENVYVRRGFLDAKLDLRLSLSPE